MKASTKLSLSVSKNLILCLDFCRVLESKADAALAAERHEVYHAVPEPGVVFSDGFCAWFTLHSCLTFTLCRSLNCKCCKRLGHASMNMTEKTYLHIIQELENKDVDLVMRSLTSLV